MVVGADRAGNRHGVARLAAQPGELLGAPALVPGLAAALLLLLAIIVTRPAPKIQPAPESDAQILEDVFLIVSRSEPRPVEPVRGLFQVDQ